MESKSEPQETQADCQDYSGCTLDALVPYYASGNATSTIVRHFTINGPTDPHSAEEDRVPQTEILTWGRGDFGQLMTDQEDEERSAPKPVHRFDNLRVTDVNCSAFATTVVTETGEVYAAGNNDEGQLFHNIHAPVVSAPKRQEDLETHRILQVASGASHTVVLNNDFFALSYGSNEYGQLGHSKDKVYRVPPRIIRLKERVVQVACGENHTLLLTNNAEVYSAGCGVQGALGHGDRDNRAVPSKILGLVGLPVGQIAAGGNHSLAVTCTGRVYAWGRNKFGQLGIPTSKIVHAAYSPQLVPIQPSVVQAAAGDSHSAWVTRDGLLYMAGRNTSGQCGVDVAYEDVDVPRRVEGLEGLMVRQVVCGQRHTLLLTTCGNVFGFGAGEQGQLGSVMRSTSTPVKLKELSGIGVFSIASGGSHAAAARVIRGSVLSRVPSNFPRAMLTSISADLLLLVARKAIECQNLAPLKRIIADIFGRVTPLNASFLSWYNIETFEVHTDPTRYKASRRTIGTEPGLPWTESATLRLKDSEEKREDGEEKDKDEGIDTDPSSSSTEYRFVNKRSAAQGSSPIVYWPDRAGIDSPVLEQALVAIVSTYDPEVISCLVKAFNDLLDEVVPLGKALKEPDSLRFFFPLLINPLNSSDKPNIASTLIRTSVLVQQLPEHSRQLLLQWIPKEVSDVTFATRVLRPLQRHVTAAFQNTAPPPPAGLRPGQALGGMLQFLRDLFDMNEKANLVSPDKFYCEELSSMSDEQLFKHYQSWAQAQVMKTGGKGLLDFSFLLNPQAKRRILSFEAKIQMSAEMQSAMSRALLFMEAPYLILHVRRDHILSDSLNILSSVDSHRLKMPLKVIFDGEEGVDQGGVAKEFFQILVRKIFDVNFGMFTYDEDTRCYWFNPGSLETQEYRLIGTLLGLAIYNNIVLDIHFPRVVYKKLLNQEVTFNDLQGVNPALHNGMKHLLEYQGEDVENTFCLTFEASYPYYGEMKTEELVPGGSEKPVTRENRHEYVEKYVKWYLVDSIEKQFKEFARGFVMVWNGPAMNIVRAEELELFVCGTPQLNFKALEEVTEYDGGYHKDHPTIKNLWEVLHAMPLDDQRKVLLFATGSARAPLGGLQKLSFKVQRNGPDTDRLPTASTCFNTLLLPEYSSKEKLKERLQVAIRECEGFGLQ